MKTDLSYLKEMSGGNTSLVVEMINIFKEQVVEFGQEMDSLLAKKEYDSLGKLAHKAKSSVAIVGLEDLAKNLKKLELMAQEHKNIESYAGIVNQFKTETAEAVEELTVVCNNIELYF